MVEHNLVAAQVGDNRKLVWQDETGFKTAGIAVDDVNYDTGSFIDRDYDVRSLDAVSIVLENIGANSIDYTILGATKDYNAEAMDADLVDGDFTETLVANITLTASSTSTPYELQRLYPTITAIRIRAKETIALSNSTLRGDVKAF